MRMPFVAPAFLLAVGFLASCAGSAHAFFYAGGRETIGNENYHGEYGYLDFGGRLHLRPTFNEYRDDLSSGTYRTISARLAFDESRWGLGATGGGTPVVNGYGNLFFGIDGRATFFYGEAPIPHVIDLKGPSEDVVMIDENAQSVGPQGWGLTRLDLRPSVLRILHGQNFGHSALFPAQSSNNVGQTDFRGGIGFLLLKDYFTFDFSKSHYDHSLSGSDLRAQSQNLAGLFSLIQGFPNTSVSVRADLSMIPVFVPFFGYAHTTFELGQSSLNVYTMGAYLRLIRFFELGLTEQLLREAGEPNLNLTSLEATFKF